MDIARPELVRLEQEHRDHPDDRRVPALAFRQLGALGDVEFLDRGIADFFAQDIDRFLRAAVIFDQRLPDFFGRGADQLDLAFQQKAEAVDAVEIERIACRDDEAVLVARDRDHFEAARVLRLDLVDHLLRHDHVGEIDPLHLRLGSEAAGNIVGRDDALPNEQLNDAGRAVEIGPASSICLRVTSPHPAGDRGRILRSGVTSANRGWRKGNEKERRKSGRLPVSPGAPSDCEPERYFASRAAISGTKQLKSARRRRAVARSPVRRGSVPAIADKFSHDRTWRRRRRSPPRRT